MTSLPSASCVRTDLFFCSTKRTPKRLPMFPLVAFCIARPPCISKVILTCANPLSSKPELALVTLSPATIIFFSKKAEPIRSSCQSNSSFLNLDVVDAASNLNSRFAVFPIIFLAAVVS